ncbi:MAG: hypothetical protein ACR2QC_02440 [Gammaproteobacteria bacterium]
MKKPHDFLPAPRFLLGIEHGRPFIDCCDCGQRSFDEQHRARRYCANCDCTHDNAHWPPYRKRIAFKLLHPGSPVFEGARMQMGHGDIFRTEIGDFAAQLVFEWATIHPPP